MVINIIACIPEYSLATLHDFNTFLIKIFRAQMVFTDINSHRSFYTEIACCSIRVSVIWKFKKYPMKISTFLTVIELESYFTVFFFR